MAQPPLQTPSKLGGNTHVTLYKPPYKPTLLSTWPLNPNFGSAHEGLHAYRVRINAVIISYHIMSYHIVDLKRQNRLKVGTNKQTSLS